MPIFTFRNPNCMLRYLFQTMALFCFTLATAQVENEIVPPYNIKTALKEIDDKEYQLDKDNIGLLFNFIYFFHFK